MIVDNGVFIYIIINSDIGTLTTGIYMYDMLIQALEKMYNRAMLENDIQVMEYALQEIEKLEKRMGK